MTDLVSGLPGMCFVIMGLHGAWKRQGQVQSEVHPAYFLVRYFDEIRDEPTDFAIYRIEDMRPGETEGCWKFFANDEQMRDWQDRHERRP